MTHLIHSAAMPFFSGVTIPIVFLVLLLALPVLAVGYSIIDFNRTRQSAKLTDKRVGWSEFFRELLNNDFFVIWCFLAGCGMVTFAGFIIFLRPSEMSTVSVSLALILIGGLLATYGRKKLRKG